MHVVVNYVIDQGWQSWCGAVLAVLAFSARIWLVPADVRSRVHTQIVVASFVLVLGGALSLQSWIEYRAALELAADALLNPSLVPHYLWPILLSGAGVLVLMIPRESGSIERSAP